MKCPHCNSENIEVGLRMFESLNGSPVGFRFSKGLMSVVAQIHCDICKDCKTIVRSYIARLASCSISLLLIKAKL